MNINELGRPGDPKPTPQQKNHALRSLYSMLPPALDVNRFTSQDSLFDAVDLLIRTSTLEQERRERSEFKVLFLQKAQEILVDAEITDMGREFFLEDLDREYDRGVDPEKIEYDTSAILLLDLERPGSGGLFEKERASELEVKYYQHRVALLRIMHIVTDETLSIEEKRDLHPWEEGDIPLDYKPRYQQWRREIIEKHKVDPEAPKPTHQEAG